MSRLRVLFILRHTGYMRNFESLIDRLAERGHEVHLAFELPRDQAEITESLAARHPNVTWGQAPRRADRWAQTTRGLRNGRDALRYRSGLYRDAPKLAGRALRKGPRWIVVLTEPRLLRRPRVLRLLGRALAHADDALPADPVLDAFVVDHQPDVVLVSPLVDGPTQDDFVRAAHRASVPVVLCVASWDNLTNKGLVHVDLEQVIVWNEAQRSEAIQLHGLAAAAVVAPGAHSYDHWFAWQPATDREAFLTRVDLPDDKPYLLYLCSSKFIAPNEEAFVRRWLHALRNGPPELRECGVLVRPHPASGGLWADADLTDFGAVRIWPPVGADPLGTGRKSEYFDSMYHCAAAVAVNTSAVVELAILGKPAFTVLDEQFADTQGGTPHFAHLADTAGGALTTAGTFPEHLDQLTHVMRDPSPGGAKSATFLHHFIRPHGLDVPAAPRAADVIESVAARGATFVPTARRSDPLVRLALTFTGDLPLPRARNADGVRRAPRRLTASEQRDRARRRRRRRHRMHKRWGRARWQVGRLLGR